MAGIQTPSLGVVSNERHPYQHLIDTFEIADHQRDVCAIPKIKTFEKAVLVEINTRNSLEELIDSLVHLSEISVYLIRSSSSYKNIMCYLLIGTDTGNYIIDLIKLRDSILLLKPVFINPKIVKILFDADEILAPLQTELQLYIINIFDIRIARQYLGLTDTALYVLAMEQPKIGFCTNILGHSTEVFTERPATDTVKRFCKLMIHYLLKFYRQLRNKLIQISENSYIEVLKKSNVKCSIVYQDLKQVDFMELFDDLKNIHRYEVDLLEALYNWRNNLGKNMNQNPNRLIGKRVILDIVFANPETKNELFQIVKTPFIESNCSSLLGTIQSVQMKYSNIPKRPKIIGTANTDESEPQKTQKSKNSSRQTLKKQERKNRFLQKQQRSKKVSQRSRQPQETDNKVLGAITDKINEIATNLSNLIPKQLPQDSFIIDRHGSKPFEPEQPPPVVPIYESNMKFEPPKLKFEPPPNCEPQFHPSATYAEPPQFQPPVPQQPISLLDLPPVFDLRQQRNFSNNHNNTEFYENHQEYPDYHQSQNRNRSQQQNRTRKQPRSNAIGTNQRYYDDNGPQRQISRNRSRKNQQQSNFNNRRNQGRGRRRNNYQTRHNC